MTMVPPDLSKGSVPARLPHSPRKLNARRHMDRRWRARPACYDHVVTRTGSAGAGGETSVHALPRRAKPTGIEPRSVEVMNVADRMGRLGTESAFEVLARAKALERQGR